MAEKTKYKLVYFDQKGKGECIRLAFHYLGIAFEDCRLSKEEFQDMKASGRLMFGQLPALEITTIGDDGEEKVFFLSQSLAILRFVGRLKPEKELYPSDAIAAARVNAIADQEADLGMGFRVVKYNERYGFGFLKEEKYKSTVLKETIEAINKEVLPRHLLSLAKQLEMGATGWLGGTKDPSIADFFWAPRLESIQNGWTGDSKILGQFPLLCQFLERFFSLGQIVEYSEKEKKKIS